MGLYNWFRTQVTGVDLAAEQASINASDARLAALNQSARDSGLYNQATYDLASANWYSGRIPDAAGDVNSAFAAGARQGFDNVTGIISDTINAPVKWSLKFIWQALPKWVWVVLLLAVLWYFGILQRILRKVQTV